MIPRHLQIALLLLLVVLFGAAFYMVRLRQVDRDRAARADRTPAPPVALGGGSPRKIGLFIAYDDDRRLALRTVTARLPSALPERVRTIVSVLLDQYKDEPSPHPISDQAEVRAVFVTNGDTAVIDLSREFAEEHESGIVPEMLSVRSMALSIGANLPEIRAVKFTVDGVERETLAGHADLQQLYRTRESGAALTQ